MYMHEAVPDPDLEIRGGAVIQTLRKGAQSPKKNFLFGLKMRGGGRPPWLLPWICHCKRTG